MCVTAAIDNPVPNNRIETDASRRSSGPLNGEFDNEISPGGKFRK